MEMKKSKKAQLGRKRGQFLIIGVIIALSLSISAFEWKTYGDTGHVDSLLVYKFEPDVIIPPTIHEELRPPKPKVIKDIIEVEKEIDINELDDILIDVEDFKNFEPEDYIEPPKEEEVPDFIYRAEVMPEFEGGQVGFLKYVAKHIKYPPEARRMGIEGRVYIEFVIDTNGKIVDVKTFKGIGAGCEEEAMRVIENAPAWKPGKQRGKPVRVKMVLPINFTLG